MEETWEGGCDSQSGSCHALGICPCVFMCQCALVTKLFPSWICFFFSLWFLGPHLQYTEVPRLGVELELQLPAYTTARAMRDSSRICDLHPSSWQRQILNPLSGARDGTCVLMDPRWAPYREIQRELPNDCFPLDCLSFEGRRLLISFQWYIPSRALSRLSINYMLLETCSG